MRFLSSGGLFFLAMVCGIIFIGAGQPEAGDALNWRIGSATIGGLSLIGALFMAWKNR